MITARIGNTNRIIVANHVLLSTMWHAVSVWMFDKHAISTVKACIKGFLWAEIRKDNATTKVSCWEFG